MIYLHENGVTVVATDEAKRGKVYELNGEKYYVARGVADIKRMVDSGEYPLNRVITSKLTTLNYLFQIRGGYGQAVPKNFNDDITNWDTSNVLSMEEVFSGWPEFNQDISNWDTSKVESMHGMFKSSKYVGNYSMGPASFNQDISNWDTSRVKNMSEMFLGATSFNQDISNWDVGSVENMDYMFSGATSFNQPIGNWDVSNVKTMRGMFSDVVAIGILAFVGTYLYTSSGSTSFNQPIGNWDVSNVKNMADMFSGATSFNQDISNWDVSNVKDMSSMFSDSYMASEKKIHPSFNQPIGNWNVSNVKNMADMFSGATSFNQDISNWNVGSVERMSGMFSGATSFNQPIGNWDVSNVKNMADMFKGATSFNQNLNGWNVSSLSGVENMFYGATSFNAPIGKWKVKSITNMQNMFREATAFNQDISSWDVSNVTQMKGLFQDASSFNQNIRNWKLNEKLPKSRTMFKDAEAFNIKEYNPFLNKKAKKRNIDTGIKLNPEDKKAISKIKKFLITRDYDKIDIGLELLISLNNLELFETLLLGCKIEQGEDRWGKVIDKLIKNKFFTGSEPAQPFLDYALINIIANAPGEVKMDSSIMIKNISSFKTNILNLKHPWSVNHSLSYSPKFLPLDKLNFLKYLKIDFSSFDLKEIKLEEVFINKNIIELDVSKVSGSVKWIKNFSQLKSLTFTAYLYSSSKALDDIESFRHLKNLEHLNLSSNTIGNLNFLGGCKKIKTLQLICDGLKDISALRYLKELEELEISGLDSKFNIDAIQSCDKLKKLNLGLKENISLNPLKNCKSLETLKLSTSKNGISGKFSDINGLKTLKNLKNINIGNLTLSGIDNGILMDKLNSEVNKSTETSEVIRVNRDNIVDDGNTIQYKGSSFTGILYADRSPNNFDTRYSTKNNTDYSNLSSFDNSKILITEIEMVNGLKNGVYREFYNSFRLKGKIKLEKKYKKDEFIKVVGFYSEDGINVLGEETCLPAHLLEYRKTFIIDKVYSNAYKSGIKKGDKIISVNNNKITDFNQLRKIIGSNSNSIIQITIERNNILIDKRVDVNEDSKIGIEINERLFCHNDKPFTGFSLIEINEPDNKDLKRYSLTDLLAESAWTKNYNKFSVILELKDGKINKNIAIATNDKYTKLSVIGGCAVKSMDFLFEGIEHLPISNLAVETSEGANNSNQPLEGKSIVVTGIFENYSRVELKKIIESNGGKPTSSVSKNTAFILAGSKMGPKKKRQAEELNIIIIGEEEFIKQYGSDTQNQKEKTGSETYLSLKNFFVYNNNNNYYYSKSMLEVKDGMVQKIKTKSSGEKIKTALARPKLTTEDRKAFSEIKKLLNSRDFDKIDEGVKMLVSINNLELFETLLDGCKIGKDYPPITQNKFFTGSGPAQPYLDYALINIIANAPQEAKIDNSLLLKNITSYDTNMMSTREKFQFPPINKFSSLSSLNIDFSYMNLDKINLEDVFINKNIIELNVDSSKGSLKWMKNFNHLKSMTFISGYHDKASWDTNKRTPYMREREQKNTQFAENLKSFEHLKNLEELYLGECIIENIDFLRKCKKIKKLHLDLHTDLTDNDFILKNINALKNLKELEELEISNLYKGVNMDALLSCKKLKKLDLNFKDTDVSLSNKKDPFVPTGHYVITKGEYHFGYTSTYNAFDNFKLLKNCNLLETLVLSGDACPDIVAYGKISDIEGLKGLKNLKNLNIGENVKISASDNNIFIN